MDSRSFSSLPLRMIMAAALCLGLQACGQQESKSGSGLELRTNEPLTAEDLGGEKFTFVAHPQEDEVVLFRVAFENKHLLKIQDTLIIAKDAPVEQTVLCLPYAESEPEFGGVIEDWEVSFTGQKLPTVHNQFRAFSTFGVTIQEPEKHLNLVAGIDNFPEREHLAGLLYFGGYENDDISQGEEVEGDRFEFVMMKLSFEEAKALYADWPEPQSDQSAYYNYKRTFRTVMKATASKLESR